MKAHKASAATKAKKDHSVLESSSDNITITIIIVIVIAVSGYHLQAGASFSRHIISIIELSFRSLEFLWPYWGRGWGTMKKLTGRYIITGSRSSNRERRWGERRKVEGAGQHPGCFPTPTETATPENSPFATTLASALCSRIRQGSGRFLLPPRVKY